MYQSILNLSAKCTKDDPYIKTSGIYTHLINLTIQQIQDVILTVFLTSIIFKGK